MKMYLYQALEGTSNQGMIRILQLLPGQENEPIRCKIGHHSLTDNPQYEALSYCWGDAGNKVLLEIQGASLSITQNLHLALLHLRLLHAPRSLWVDAICIDQSNIPERNSQVKLMRDIYEKAKEVLIWLGKEEDNSTDGFELIKQLEHVAAIDTALGVHRNLWEWDNDHRGLPITTEQVWYDTFKIIKRPWFYRSWIIQEVAVASKATVICGKSSVDWRTFIRAFEFVISAGLGLTFAPKAMGNLLLIDYSRKKFAEGIEQEPLQVLLRNRHSLATDERDHVFAFAGLITQRPIVVVADYTLKPERVFTQIAINILCRNRKLDILSAPRNLVISKVSSLPTWVPDWSTSDTCESLLSKSGESEMQIRTADQFKASADTECSPIFSEDQSKLMLEGYVFDEIHMTSLVSESGADHVPRDLGEMLAVVTADQAILAGWEYCARLWSQWRYEPTGELMIDAYWQTLSGGRILVSFGYMQSAFMAWQKSTFLFRLLIFLRLNRVGFLKPVMMFVLWVAHIMKWPALTKMVMLEPQVAFKHVATPMAYRRMIRTEKGYIGLAPRLAKPGDWIALCKGGRLPLVVRPKDEDWELIGDAYIHGLVNGEQFDKEDCKPMWFV